MNAKNVWWNTLCEENNFVREKKILKTVNSFVKNMSMKLFLGWNENWDKTFVIPNSFNKKKSYQHKTQNVTQLKNSNCHKTKPLKMWRTTTQKIKLWKY